MVDNLRMDQHVPANSGPAPAGAPGISGKTGAPPPFRSRRFDQGPASLALFSVLFLATVWTTWIQGGPWFSLNLLLILTAHEFGHYFACVRNNVDASLPRFLPAPPMFLAGTFGAFIRIKEPIPTRKALMEIGASGPLAGFVVAIPVIFIGIALSEVRPAMPVGNEQTFGHSLVSWAATQLILGPTPGGDVMLWIHPAAFAGWFGLFFTSINLLPIGQLDGSHVIYSLFPAKQPMLAKIFFVCLLMMGYIWLGWLVLAAMILLMGFRHPPVLDVEETLEPFHKMMGYSCILVFFLTLVPVPLSLV